MTAIATLVLVGTPAVSVLPFEGVPVAGGQLFQPRPSGAGQSVASCGGTSPVNNLCGTAFARDQCESRACAPDVKGGLAYTGSITATITGQDRWASPVHVSWTCDYIASSTGRVGPASLGGCWSSTNAAYECNTDPATGARVCGHYMWPPFSLKGVATPPMGGNAALGSWSVSVDRV